MNGRNLPAPLNSFRGNSKSIDQYRAMKNLIMYTTFLFVTIHANGQNTEINLDEKISQSHEKYKADFIVNRRFKHEQVMNYLDDLKSPLELRKVGSSVAGKEIRMVSYGEGETKVLLWSQMHGNEPTATMALMDIFNFLTASNDGFDDYRKLVSENLSVHFIPMLNPDGADKYVRRNDQGIDINRDALRLQTPEGRILKRMRDSLDADWGFNLHDQGRASYITDKSATISVLAPAYDFPKSINEKRGNAMQLIALMNESFQKFIPDQVSQYDDSFEPRAFGDNIQKWGTRTILIESGGLIYDREKQEIRKLNFMAMLMALHGIATDSYNRFTTDDYFQIPPTNRGFRDVIVKNIQLPESLGGNITDIAFNFQERENESRSEYYLRASLVDIGDLSTSGGYLIHDVEGYEVKKGKMSEEIYSSADQLKKGTLHGLLKSGVTDIKVEFDPTISDRKSIPFKIANGNNNSNASRLSLGSNPSLLFYKNGVLEYVLINGYFFSPQEEWKTIINGMKKL